MGSDTLTIDVRTEAGGSTPRLDSDETSGTKATYRIGRGVVRPNTYSQLSDIPTSY